MKKHSLCIMVAALAVMLMSPTVTHGQFHTIHSDNENLSVSLDPYSFPKGDETSSKNDTKVTQKSVQPKIAAKKSQATPKIASAVSSPKATKSAQKPPTGDSDSLLFELIKKRLNVCMPLNYMRLTSGYGYRIHPIKRCRKFHDGIDLAAGQDGVFSMLPGRVETVRHGNTGYGNYVVLNHWQLRCLYGHLSRTLVSEGEYVDAGTVIGITGRSGVATGFHLHLKLEKRTADGWKSVNPKAFTDYLEDYIADLGRQLRKYENTADSSDEPLTIGNLYAALKRHGIKYPRIVLAQAILETGHFSSPVCKNKHNLFGLRNPRTGEYYAFDKWEDSVLGYKNMVQYRYKGSLTSESSYYSWLDKIGYAADKSYIYKVREIAERL